METTTLPTVGELASSTYTVKHWLNYYQNIWKRNAIAGIIDVESDRVRVEKDPAKEVPYQQFGRVLTVSVADRLELRKEDLQDTMILIAKINTLVSEYTTDEEFIAKYANDEVLKTIAAGDHEVATGNETAAAQDSSAAAADTKPLDTKKYKVLKDFGDVKAGEILDLPQAGWPEGSVEARIADGTIALADETAKPEAATI